MVHAASGYDLALMGYQPSQDMPAVTGIFVADVLGGLYANSAIQTALFQRERTGLGQRIDTTLIESMLNLLIYEMQFEQQPSEARRPRYGPLRTLDGFVIVLPINANNFMNLCEAVGHPEWADDPLGAITVEQLLTMSSGLAPLSYEGGGEAPARQFMAGRLDARETILNLQFHAADAPHFHYINTVSQLLLMVVENATGQAYTDYLSENLGQPIGASDAYVYNFEEGRFPRGYASLLARPLDWLRLGLLLKDDGQFAGKQVIDAGLVRDLKSPSRHNPDYGWHVWRGETWEAQRFYNEEKTGFSVTQSAPFAVDDLVYFDGFGGQRVYTSESENLVIVRLGNTSTSWDDAKLPNRVIAALHSRRED